MTEQDYPYASGTSGIEYQCAHNWNKIWGYAGMHHQVEGTVDDLKARLREGPLSIAVDAGRAPWQYYSSGVVKVTDGCGDSLNHAVVVVGYTDSSEYDDDDNDNDNDNDNDTDDNDNEDNDNDDGNDDGGVGGCEGTKWWHTCD